MTFDGLLYVDKMALPLVVDERRVVIAWRRYKTERRMEGE